MKDRTAKPTFTADVKHTYLQSTIHDHCEAGVRPLWIVDPEVQTVTVYRSPVNLRILSAADTLTGEDVLAEFSCPVTELFA